MKVITVARENHVDIICLPPHGSHKMQTLDNAFTIYQIGELFGNACKQATTGEIAANGFRATGLFPCDKNIFRPYYFPLSSENKKLLL
jgi:hypothetical protein